MAQLVVKVVRLRPHPSILSPNTAETSGVFKIHKATYSVNKFNAIQFFINCSYAKDARKWLVKWKHILFYFFYLYIYLPDSLENVGAAIHRVCNYPDLLPEMPRYCCPVEIFYFVRLVFAEM